jgi:outer membrane protein TolC
MQVPIPQFAQAVILPLALLGPVLALAVAARGQTIPDAGATAGFGSVNTPRPINPASDTTNPSARATQDLNPYLGSTPNGEVTKKEELHLSLEDAIGRGLKYNLGLIDSQEASSEARAQREHALAALLPQISARAEQTYQQFSLKSINLMFPPQTGIHLSPTSGQYGYSEARLTAQSPILNVALLDRYRQQKEMETASALSAKDARDVVVFVVGSAYFQVVASEARLETAQAALASMRELNAQVADQFKSDVSPEIDTLRATVELHTTEQRVTDAANDLEKDKLTLDRITGIPLGQAWTPAGEYDYVALASDAANDSHTVVDRFDVASAKATLTAAEFRVRAARSERLPEISFNASYGGGGANPASYNRVDEVVGSVSLPLFTSGRIRSDIHAAESDLVQRRAELADIEGRADYDVRTARLDAQASESGVKVAGENRELAERALAQSQDRYKNGITNYLEVLEAEEALVAANENYIASLFSFNVAKISLARALGSAESRVYELFGATHPAH